MGVAIQVLAGTVTGQDFRVPFGGPYAIEASSLGWNGATATLQIKTGAGTYASIGSSGVFTADGIAIAVIGDGATVRVAISGGPPSQPVNVWLRKAGK